MSNSDANKNNSNVEEQPQSKKSKVIKLTAIFLTISILIALFIYFFPILRQIQQEPQPFIYSIRSMGFIAVFVVIFLAAIQLVIPFVPGEIVEILTGAIYGPWIGLLIVQIGIALGVIIVYYLVKFLGSGFSKKMIGSNFEGKFKILDNPNRLEIVMFFTLLMPFVPKDMVAYVLPLTKVKLHRFLILNAIARTPTIVASTILGNAVVAGSFSLSLIILATCAIVGVLGLIFNKRIVDYIETEYVNKSSTD